MDNRRISYLGERLLSGWSALDLVRGTAEGENGLDIECAKGEERRRWC